MSSRNRRVCGSYARGGSGSREPPNRLRGSLDSSKRPRQAWSEASWNGPAGRVARASLRALLAAAALGLAAWVGAAAVHASSSTSGTWAPNDPFLHLEWAYVPSTRGGLDVRPAWALPP